MYVYMYVCINERGNHELTLTVFAIKVLYQYQQKKFEKDENNVTILELCFKLNNYILSIFVSFFLNFDLLISVFATCFT